MFTLIDIRKRKRWL